VPQGALEVEDIGEGPLAVVVQTALDLDELGALAHSLSTHGFRVVHYRRRGYGASGPALPHPSVSSEAADCAAVVRGLGTGPAHLVGASYSAAIALTTAAETPDVARTLTVLEPPPVHIPDAADFVAANQALLRTRRARGPTCALDDLMHLLAGEGWREDFERERPGSVGALERDAATFFDRDVPALLGWRFGAEEAHRVRCPVLHIGGDRSGPWFHAVRDWLLGLLPQATDETVQGAGHLLGLTHADEVAGLVARFTHNTSGPT
jgi:pimeloyl-ACP methyl ester carboxylesterase